MSRCVPRPGFNLDLTFRYHVGKVRDVVPMGHRGCFISYDATTLKIWQQSTLNPHNFDILHDMAMPHNQYNFVSTLCYNPNSNHIMVACADNSLKIFTDKLRLRCSLPWVNSSLAAMVYNPVTDGLITSGAAGVKLWHSNPDQAGYQRAKAANEPVERPLILGGKPVPWCYGSFERNTNKLTYQVPGLIPRGKSLAPDVQDEFCEHLQLLVEQQTLVVMFRVDVFVYQASDGTLLFSWRGLSGAPLSDAVYLPQQQMLITASTDPQLAAWKVDPSRTLELQRHFGRSPAGFHSIAVSPKRNWVMSSSLDGLVVVWDIETFTATFTMRCTQPLFGLKFYQEDRFLCRHGDKVKLFNVLQLFETWITTTAPVVSLRPLSYGLLLATFADSSVRVLDACSAYGYSHSVVSTPPQLSTSDLVGAAVGLTAGRLYALLHNGHVHVWELHLQRPPTFQEAWTHLAKEQGSSIAFLDGALVPQGVASNLGLSVSPDTRVPEPHLVIGTRSGEVVVVDAVRRGLLLLRLPLFRVDPVSHVLLDLDRLLLVAGAACGVRVVDLTTAAVVAEVDTEHNTLTSLDLLNSTAMMGYASGTVRLLDLNRGLVGRPGTAAEEEKCSEARGHTSRVVSVAASPFLQHFVTCSVDGSVKVWDQQQHLAAALDLSRPLVAACFLNDQGDLLLGWDRHLLVVRSAAYAMVPIAAASGANSNACSITGSSSSSSSCSLNGARNLAAGSSAAGGQSGGPRSRTLFDGVAAKAVLPRALLRNMTSALQEWCTTPVPKQKLPQDWSAMAAEFVPRSQRALVDLERSRVRASLLRGNAGERQVLRQNTLTAAVFGQISDLLSNQPSQLMEESSGSRPAKRSVIEAAAAATMAYVEHDGMTAAAGSPSRSSSPAPGGYKVKDSLSAAASLASIHDQMHKPPPASMQQGQQAAATGDPAAQQALPAGPGASGGSSSSGGSCGNLPAEQVREQAQQQEQQQEQQALPAVQTASQAGAARRSLAGQGVAGPDSGHPGGPPVLSTAGATAAAQRVVSTAGGSSGGGGLHVKKAKVQVTFAGAVDTSSSSAAGVSAGGVGGVVRSSAAGVAAGGGGGGGAAAAAGDVRGSSAGVGAAGKTVSMAGGKATAGHMPVLEHPTTGAAAATADTAAAAAAVSQGGGRQRVGGSSMAGVVGNHCAETSVRSLAAGLSVDVGEGAVEGSAAAAAATDGSLLYVQSEDGLATLTEGAAETAEAAAAAEVISQLATMRGTSAAQRRRAMAELEGISDPGMAISGLSRSEEDPETWRTWYACNVHDVQRQAWAATLKRTLGLEASIQSLMAQQLKLQQEKARPRRSTAGQLRSARGTRSAANSCRTTAEHDANSAAAAAAGGAPQEGTSDGTTCDSRTSSGSGSGTAPASVEDTASSSACPGAVKRSTCQSVSELPELPPGSGGAARRTASIAGAGPDEVYHIGQLQVTVPGAHHRRTSLCSVAVDEEAAATAAAATARRSSMGAARASIAGGTGGAGQPLALGQSCTLPSIRPASRDAAAGGESHDQQPRGGTAAGGTDDPEPTAAAVKANVQQEQGAGSSTCAAGLPCSSSSSSSTGNPLQRTTRKQAGAGGSTLAATTTAAMSSSMQCTATIGSSSSGTAGALDKAAAAAAEEDAVLRDTSSARLDGLPILMRKIAPVVSHPNAFLDDCTPPPEIAAIIQKHKAANAAAKAPKGNKTSKKTRRRAQNDLAATGGARGGSEAEQGGHGSLRAGAMKGTVAALATMAEGAAAAGGGGGGRGARSGAANAPTISWGGAGYNVPLTAEASSLSQRICGTGLLSQQASAHTLETGRGGDAAAGGLLASNSAAPLRQAEGAAVAHPAAAIAAERSGLSMHQGSSSLQVPLVDMKELADAVAGTTRPWLGPQACAAFSSTSNPAPNQHKSKQQAKTKKTKKTKRAPLVPHWQLATAASTQRAQEVYAETAERTGQPLQRLQGELTMASSFWHSSSNMLAGSSSMNQRSRGTKKGGKQQPELTGDQVAAALTASEFERLLRAARRRQDLSAPIASDVRLGLKELEVHEARQEAASKQWLSV